MSYYFLYKAYPMALSTTYQEKALPRTTPEEVCSLWSSKLWTDYGLWSYTFIKENTHHVSYLLVGLHLRGKILCEWEMFAYLSWVWRTMLCSKSTFSYLLIKWLLTLHCKSNDGYVLFWELIILQILCSIFKDLFCQDLIFVELLVFTNIYV